VLDNKTSAVLEASLAVPKLRRLELPGGWLSDAAKKRLRRARRTEQLEVMDFDPQPRTGVCVARWRGIDVPLD
jgi:hypothetical protein